jgi:hypothetical protein
LIFSKDIEVEYWLCRTSGAATYEFECFVIEFAILRVTVAGLVSCHQSLSHIWVFSFAKLDFLFSWTENVSCLHYSLHHLNFTLSTILIHGCIGTTVEADISMDLFV